MATMAFRVLIAAALASTASAVCTTVSAGGDNAAGFKSAVCPVDAKIPHTPKCLMVFPGKGNNYDSFTIFQETAARMGYSVFSLQFHASPDTFSVCHKDYDNLDCSRQVRMARQVGGDQGPGKEMKLDVKQSADYRATLILKWLAGLSANPPPESTGDVAQWKNCLKEVNGEWEVNWSKMAVAGGSEGSGQAAFTGYHHSVDRVLMFSGMVDAIEYDLRAGNYTAAPYIVDGKGKTPHSRYWGFGEVYGGACRAWQVNYNSMKMTSAWTNVNLVNPNYGYGTAHKLCSDRTKSAAGHLTTLWDKNTPKDSKGEPVYRPVWEHMLGSPPSLGSSNTTQADSSTSLLAPLNATADPRPVPPNTPVALVDCADYKSLTQRWVLDEKTSHVKLVDALDKPEGQPLVLTCQNAACNQGERLVVTAPVEGDVAQQWQFTGGHFVSQVSKLCIGTDYAAEPEAGLLVLQDCSTPTTSKWAYNKGAAHYTTEGVCLGAKYSSGIKCSCVF